MRCGSQGSQRRSRCSTSTTRPPTSSCQARSTWPCRRPSPACAETPLRAVAPNRRCSRPAPGFRCRCSSTSGTSYASTRARASTSHVRRTDQRRAAIWALYQSDLLGRPLDETFPHDIHHFTRELAMLVREHQPELDELIARYSQGWSLERIAPLERSILRVALVELLHG